MNLVGGGGFNCRGFLLKYSLTLNVFGRPFKQSLTQFLNIYLKSKPGDSESHAEFLLIRFVKRLVKLNNKKYFRTIGISKYTLVFICQGINISLQDFSHQHKTMKVNGFSIVVLTSTENDILKTSFLKHRLVDSHCEGATFYCRNL